MVPKEHGLGGVPWETDSEAEVCGQEVDRGELAETTPVRSEGSRTQRGSSANTVQSQKSRVIPQGALKLRWPFRDIPNGGKGPRTYTPAMTSHWLQAAPGEGMWLERGSTLQLKAMHRERHTVGGQQTVLLVAGGRSLAALKWGCRGTPQYSLQEGGTR